MSNNDDTTTSAVGILSDNETGVVQKQDEVSVPSLSATMDSLAVATATPTTDINDPPRVTTKPTVATIASHNHELEGFINEDKEDVTGASISTTSILIPDPKSIPISLVRRFRIDKYDIDTNITVQLFQERYIVTCSQTSDGKITAWLLCQPILNMYALKRQLQWEVSHLLGGGKRDDTLLTVYCQRISTLLWERLNAEGDQQQLPSSMYQPKTILFGFTLCRKMPNGGIVQSSGGSDDNSNAIKADSNIVGIHEPELFHTMVDIVVQTVIEAMSTVDE